MSNDLSTGIVRILDSTGVTAGTGFVVTEDGLIATCAHVVRGAGVGPGNTVRVAFHLSGEEREAYIEPAWPAPNLTLLNNALQQTGWTGERLVPENWRAIVRRRVTGLPWERVIADVFFRTRVRGDAPDAGECVAGVGRVATSER